MKKLAFFVFAALFASLTVNAQDFSKIAAKEAKSYKKQGWVVAPGQFPLEYQLARAYQLRSERDNNDYEVYVDGQAQSVGATYDAAKMQALEMAKLQLASKLQTQITQLSTILWQITSFQRSRQSQSPRPLLQVRPLSLRISAAC